MKALEKDRSRRYETASGLAEDIKRHLDGNPVMACPPTFAYKFSKFASRYRSQVALAAGVLGVMLVSSFIAWFLLLAAQAARNELEVANGQLVAETERAVQSEQLAESSEQRALQAQKTIERNLYDEKLVSADNC